MRIIGWDIGGAHVKAIIIDFKKKKGKNRNIIKDMMGVGNNRKIQGVCYIGHGDSFNNRQLLEKMNKLELDHSQEESTSP